MRRLIVPCSVSFAAGASLMWQGFSPLTIFFFTACISFVAYALIASARGETLRDKDK